MILMPQIFDVTANENACYKRNELELWNDVKGLVMRNAHMQYESPSSSCLKVMANVKVFEK